MSNTWDAMAGNGVYDTGSMAPNPDFSQANKQAQQTQNALQGSNFNPATNYYQGVLNGTQPSAAQLAAKNQTNSLDAANFAGASSTRGGMGSGTAMKNAMNANATGNAQIAGQAAAGTAAERQGAASGLGNLGVAQGQLALQQQGLQTQQAMAPSQMALANRSQNLQAGDASQNAGTGAIGAAATVAAVAALSDARAKTDISPEDGPKSNMMSSEERNGLLSAQNARNERGDTFEDRRLGQVAKNGVPDYMTEHDKWRLSHGYQPEGSYHDKDPRQDVDSYMRGGEVPTDKFNDYLAGQAYSEHSGTPHADSILFYGTGDPERLKTREDDRLENLAGFSGRGSDRQQTYDNNFYNGRPDVPPYETRDETWARTGNLSFGEDQAQDGGEGSGLTSTIKPWVAPDGSSASTAASKDSGANKTGSGLLSAGMGLMNKAGQGGPKPDDWKQYVSMPSMGSITSDIHFKEDVRSDERKKTDVAEGAARRVGGAFDGAGLTAGNYVSRADPTGYDAAQMILSKGPAKPKEPPMVRSAAGDIVAHRENKHANPYQRTFIGHNSSIPDAYQSNLPAMQELLNRDPNEGLHPETALGPRRPLADPYDPYMREMNPEVSRRTIESNRAAMNLGRWENPHYDDRYSSPSDTLSFDWRVGPEPNIPEADDPWKNLPKGHTLGQVETVYDDLGMPIMKNGKPQKEMVRYGMDEDNQIRRLPPAGTKETDMDPGTGEDSPLLALTNRDPNEGPQVFRNRIAESMGGRARTELTDPADPYQRELNMSPVRRSISHPNHGDDGSVVSDAGAKEDAHSQGYYQAVKDITGNPDMLRQIASDQPPQMIGEAGNQWKYTPEGYVPAEADAGGITDNGSGYYEGVKAVTGNRDLLRQMASDKPPQIVGEGNNRWQYTPQGYVPYKAPATAPQQASAQRTAGPQATATVTNRTPQRPDVIVSDSNAKEDPANFGDNPMHVRRRAYSEAGPEQRNTTAKDSPTSIVSDKDQKKDIMPTEKKKDSRTSDNKTNTGDAGGSAQKEAKRGDKPSERKEVNSQHTPSRDTKSATKSQEKPSQVKKTDAYGYKQPMNYTGHAWYDEYFKKDADVPHGDAGYQGHPGMSNSMVNPRDHYEGPGGALEIRSDDQLKMQVARQDAFNAGRMAGVQGIAQSAMMQPRPMAEPTPPANPGHSHPVGAFMDRPAMSQGMSMGLANASKPVDNAAMRFLMRKRSER